MKLLGHCHPVYIERVDKTINDVFVAPDCDVCCVDLAHISADPVIFRVDVRSCPVTDTRKRGWFTGEGPGELLGDELIRPTCYIFRPFVRITANNETCLNMV